MFELEVESSFSACHALRGYRGKCENLHGHNYKVQLTLAGNVLDEIGLLCDFKELKRALTEVLDQFDHKNLNEADPFREVNPSAENLAQFLYGEVGLWLSKSTKGRARVARVKVWETDGNSASYFQ
jgi:6-pyruvoyltetrahydropterin/6-carboxytetrahydropterin synthase